MPTPTTSLATLRPDLGGSFMEFGLAMDEAGFIGQRVLPVFETMKQAGPFGKFTIEQLLQSPDTKRAPGSGYQRLQHTFTTDSFAVLEQGLEEAIDDREADMYRDFFQAEAHTALRLRNIIMRAAEQRVADAIFNTTTWTPTGVTNEWDDYANATPRKDVEDAAQRLFTGSGLWPNALIISRGMFRHVRQTDDVIDLMKSQNFQDVRASEITPQALAFVFDLGMVLVGGEPKNTADEGQSVSIAPIWSNEYAAVCRVAVSGDIREPCVGRTFHWSADGSTIGGTVEEYRDENQRSDIIRVRHDTDEKVLYVEALELLDNIIT